MGALLGSKKFKVALAAILADVSAGLTGTLTWREVIMAVSVIAVGYIIAQGVADINKEAVKTEAEAK